MQDVTCLPSGEDSREGENMIRGGKQRNRNEKKSASTSQIILREKKEENLAAKRGETFELKET